MLHPEQPARPLFERVVIAGVGLIGGSLGIDLRERALAGRVVGLVRRQATVRDALAAGAIDEATLDPAAAARGADLIVLAAPVFAIPPLVEQMAPFLAPGAIVTDVASTKAYLMRAVPPLLPAGIEYVGGHPMAGSEHEGVRHARRDLFRGTVWALTRRPDTPCGAVEQVEALVRALGAEPLVMDAELHDTVVARVSHLPHVVAAALALAVLMDDPLAPGDAPEALLRRMASSGYRSTTRVAAGPAPVWRDICLSNRAALLASVHRFEQALAELRRALAAGDPEALTTGLEAAREARVRLVGDPGEEP